MEGVRAVAHESTIGTSNVVSAGRRVNDLEHIRLGLVEGAAGGDVEILSQHVLRSVRDPLGNLESSSVVIGVR